MTKEQLITAISEKAELNKRQAGAALEAFIETVSKALVDKDEITLRGFGTFGVFERAARDCIAPATGEPIHVEACTVPRFKASKLLKDMVADANK